MIVLVLLTLSSAEIVLNGGFEQDKEYWDSSKYWVTDTATKCGGDKSMKVTLSGDKH